MTIILTAALALSAPVYLECQMTGSATGQTSSDAPWDWTITLNETDGWADYHNKNGSKRVLAKFTANEVVFDDFTINRINLQFTRYFQPLNAKSYGKCRLAQAEKRAF